MTISPELRQALEEAKGEPLRIEDPENQAAYVVVKADAYAKMRAISNREDGEESRPNQVSEGIRLAQDAFFRDLPTMLGDRKLKGKWVLYHRERRIAAAPKERDLIAEVIRRPFSPAASSLAPKT